MWVPKVVEMILKGDKKELIVLTIPTIQTKQKDIEDIVYINDEIPSVPPLFLSLNWDPPLSETKLILLTTGKSSYYVQGKKWIAKEDNLNTTNWYSTVESFKKYYEDILIKDGWSKYVIEISNRQIMGEDSAGRLGSGWSYLKKDANNLYTITLRYQMYPAGFDENPEGDESDFYCPCNNTYEVIVGKPVSLNELN